MQRAVAQEKEITVQLGKETERAAGKENELNQMLTEEISRAKTAENGLNENLMEEIQRAGESENILLQSQQVLAEKIDSKVEKEDGKGLSENDYTTEEKISLQEWKNMLRIRFSSIIQRSQPIRISEN